MTTQRVREFLDKNETRHILISHSPTYSPHDTSLSAHVPIVELARTVIMRIDGRPALAVVPAEKDIDLELFRRQANANYLNVADDASLGGCFASCQKGTVPPLGNLFGVPTFIDRDLLQRREIAFAAGSHTDVIIMTTADYQHLVHPKPVRIAVEPIGIGLPVLSI